MIRPVGDLDLGTADRLWEQIRAHLAPGTRVVLDCSAITFCDSVGLQVLMRAHKHAAGFGTEFALAFTAHTLAHVLDMAGLTGRIPTVEEAAISPHATLAAASGEDGMA